MRADLCLQKLEKLVADHKDEGEMPTGNEGGEEEQREVDPEVPADDIPEVPSQPTAAKSKPRKAKTDAACETGASQPSKKTQVFHENEDDGDDCVMMNAEDAANIRRDLLKAKMEQIKVTCHPYISILSVTRPCGTYYQPAAVKSPTDKS